MLLSAVIYPESPNLSNWIFGYYIIFVMKALLHLEGVNNILDYIYTVTAVAFLD